MAFCNQCGNQLDGNAKFCTQCGKSIGGAPAPQPTPVAQPAPAATAEKKSKLPLIILAVVGVIVLAVAGMLLLGGGDEGQDMEQAQTLTYQEQYDLGMKYLLDGNYEEAIIAFQAAIDLEPMMADAYLGLADVYVAVGDYDQAVAVLDGAVAVVEDTDGLAQLVEKLDTVMVHIEQDAASESAETTTQATTTPEEIEEEPLPTEGQAERTPTEVMDSLVGTWGTLDYLAGEGYACLTFAEQTSGSYISKVGYFWSEYFPDENIDLDSIVEVDEDVYEVMVESGGAVYPYTYDLTQLDQGIFTMVAYTGFVSVWEYLAKDEVDAANIAMDNLNNPGGTDTVEDPGFPGVTIEFGPDTTVMSNTTWRLASDYFYTYNNKDAGYVFGNMLGSSNSLTFDESCNFEMWLGGLTEPGSMYGTMSMTSTTNVFDYTLDDSWGRSYAGTWYLGDIDGETVLCMRYSDIDTVFDEDYALYWCMG